MNCNLIQKELMKWVMASTTDIVVPNYYLGRYECDVMKISKAGQIYEYEIKVSKADFKKDAEKSTRGKFIGYADPIQTKWGVHRSAVYEKINKHKIILEGKRCSRFYFVVPEGLIKPEEVPDGLGLIYASPSHKDGYLNFKIIKVSKHFNKEPVKEQFYKHVAQNLTLKLISAKVRQQQLIKTHKKNVAI